MPGVLDGDARPREVDVDGQVVGSKRLVEEFEEAVWLVNEVLGEVPIGLVQVHPVDLDGLLLPGELVREFQYVLVVVPPEELLEAVCQLLVCRGSAHGCNNVTTPITVCNS